MFYSKDITTSKRLAEQSIAHEKQRADDAQHLARSQESFLDVVSVRFRNHILLIEQLILVGRSTNYEIRFRPY